MFRFYHAPPIKKSPVTAGGRWPILTSMLVQGLFPPSRGADTQSSLKAGDFESGGCGGTCTAARGSHQASWYVSSSKRKKKGPARRFAS